MRFNTIVGLAVMLLTGTIASGEGAAVTYTSWVYDGYIYFQVINDNWGSEVLFNEVCFLQVWDPAGYPVLMGREGINYVSCTQWLPYEATLEAGTWEYKVTAYDWPNAAMPPITPFYYHDQLAQNATISPWLKIVPGGWTVSSIALKNGTSSVGAYITTSRGCAGEVRVDGAYSKPVGLQTDTLPSASVTGNANAQSNTYFSLGSLVTSGSNTVSGEVRASIQLGGLPSGCGYLKDPMFESNLTIASQ